MCGVAGIFSLDGHMLRDADKRIWQMTMMLKHRGPDSQGVYISSDKILALGNTRLAIVDPLCRFEQPLRTKDDKGILSFNGEIYNYLDVKDALERQGISFRSRMDTEVLLEGLRLSGERLLQQLDGMWAFAYYEADKKQLLLSRDLLGERHIFYRIDNDKKELVFASEPKPILADADRPFDVDFEALVSSLRFYSAPPGRTLVEGVKRLLPGHNMLVDPAGNLKIYRYQRLHPEKWFDFFSKRPTLEEVIDVYEDLFHRTCKRRLPLDVPFISTLSGGIDSTLISVFASDLGKKRIKTLFGESREKSAQNPAGELDEYAASKFTSKKFNTDHIYIQMNNDECIPVLDKLAENGFDGMVDPGAASFEMLARRVAEEKLKVILISDGPDELIGGYHVDRMAYFTDRIMSENTPLYNMLKLVSSAKGARRMMHLFGKDSYYVSPFTSYDPFRFIPIHESHGASTLMDFLPKDEVLAASKHYGFMDPAYDDILPSMDYSQMRALSYAARSLPDHFNLRTDKAFLRVSVECRLPHQAPEMAEFMIAMPAHLRFNDGGTTKYLMRKIVERRVGPEIANRAKHGFSAPLWRSPNVYKAMKFEEVIRGTPMFRDLPFKKGAQERIFSPKYKKMLWPFFVLTKTYGRLKEGIYK